VGFGFSRRNLGVYLYQGLGEGEEAEPKLFENSINGKVTRVQINSGKTQ